VSTESLARPRASHEHSSGHGSGKEPASDSEGVDGENSAGTSDVRSVSSSNSRESQATLNDDAFVRVDSAAMTPALTVDIPVIASPSTVDTSASVAVSNSTPAELYSSFLPSELQPQARPTPWPRQSLHQLQPLGPPRSGDPHRFPSIRPSVSYGITLSSSTKPPLPMQPMQRVVSSRSGGLSASPSIDRLLATDHFSRTASVGFIARSESAQSASLAQQQVQHYSRQLSAQQLPQALQLQQPLSPRNGGSPPSPFNPAAALRVTFISVNSYGNTEMSFDDGADDAGIGLNGGGGGLLGGASNAFAPVRSFRSGTGSMFACVGGGGMDLPRGASGRYSTLVGATGSGAGLYCADGERYPSTVQEAAGSLYRQGDIEDRWMFRQMVGEGAFSEVRLGEGRRGGGRVAIKIINKGAPDLFGKGNVCREVLAFQTIGKHANIVECIEVCEDDRFVYIVLELLTGGLLLPRIADAEQYYPKYDERDAGHVIASMIRALAYCHAIGVAHRDVKPENVLFVCEGMSKGLKVTDFGLAHCGDRPCTDLCGTPLYVAPEVLMRQPFGCTADMWSVGVIAHILLVGYPPFDDDDIVQLINKVKFKPVRLRGPEWKIPTNDAKDFVRRLLVRDPGARMTAVDALEHPWMVLTGNDERARGRDWPLLQAAQLNIQDFVVHREFKRVVQHEHAESALKLSMLVSMSEKNLNLETDVDESGPVSIGDTTGAPSSAAASPLPNIASSGTNVGSPYSCAHVPPDGFVSSSEDTMSSSHRGGPDSRGSIPVSDAPASSGWLAAANIIKMASSPRSHATHRRGRESSHSREPSSMSSDREQADLRRRRLFVEELLRRQRGESGNEDGDYDASLVTSAAGTNTVDGDNDTSGVLLRDGHASLRSAGALTTPTASPKLRGQDTSPHLSKYAHELQGSFESRRNADADEDLVHVRGRGVTTERSPETSKHDLVRKNRLLRLSPLFSSSSSGAAPRSRGESKKVLL
jgi:serine/threonine protein kinase